MWKEGALAAARGWLLWTERLELPATTASRPAMQEQIIRCYRRRLWPRRRPRIPVTWAAGPADYTSLIGDPRRSFDRLRPRQASGLFGPTRHPAYTWSYTWEPSIA